MKLKANWYKSCVVSVGVLLVFVFFNISNRSHKRVYPMNDLSFLSDEKLLEMEENLKDAVETKPDDYFAARKQHLANACVRAGHPLPVSINQSLFSNNTLIDMRHNIIYCPVQKAGSSFWSKVLLAMSSDGEYRSPYKVKYRKLQVLQTYKKFKKDIPSMIQQNFMQKAVSLLVVRDPYTKLFSAYADKLYHPNYLFWKITGAPIRSMIGGRNSSMCGNDITFSEFIKYIIYQTNHNKTMNVHFKSNEEHCYPCQAKFDYIMKFENFEDDFNHIMTDLHSRYNLSISMENLEKDTSLYIADLHINISFSTMRLYSSRCQIPAYNFLLRTWRFLQMTGHIPKEVDLPFPDDENAEWVTKIEMLDAVKSVLESDFNRTQVKLQRYEALVQAYQGVNIKDKMKLRDVAKTDSDYFGYELKPDYLFDQRKEKLNYFDGLTSL